MSYSAEVLADAPVVYYRLGDSSGSTMADSSGSARDASYVNTPTLGAAGALAGDADTAVTFNGTSQNGIVGSGGGADVALKAISGSFTLEAWVKVSSLTSNRGVLDRYGNGGATVSSWLWYIVSGKPTFLIRNASNVDSSLTATTTLTSGAWAHIVATYDGTNQRVYLNGALDCTPKASTFSSHNRTPLLNIGKFVSSSFFFAGTMDEVAIYDTALSSTRILAHYTAGTTTTVSPPAATATAAGALPVVSGGSTVSPPAASSTAAAAVPVVHASATVTAVAATATASAAAPVIVVPGDQAVTAVAATATAVALPPSLAWSSSLSAVAATASAAALVPVVSAGATVAAVAATATATALVPTVTTVSTDAEVLAVVATATAAAYAPTVVQVFSAGTDTSNARDGRERGGSATVTLTRPVAALPNTLTLAAKVDKAIAYPAPTMVDGRPT